VIQLRTLRGAATGAYSQQDIAKLARKIGLRGRRGKHIARSNIAILLANSVYTGTFRWGGKTYEGKYEPLITRALFAEVQDVLAGRTAMLAQVHIHVQRHDHVQDLQRPPRGDRKKGKYTYYACNKCRTYYPEAFFDQYTARTLERIAIDEDMTAFLLHQLAISSRCGGPEPSGTLVRRSRRASAAVIRPQKQ
jgi:hypothetical protein